MDQAITPREMFDLPNTALRFLFDERQAQTSAVLLLQWCIDTDAMQYLREHQIDDPLLVITVVSPNGKENRQIVQLSQMQVMLQFHRSGVHKILGRILWGVDAKQKKEILKWYRRGEYEMHLDAIKDREAALGNAELEVDVPPDFFAKELSAWHQWWLTLWLGELWDECNMRRRFAFAYFVQGPLVLIWVVFNCFFRLIVAASLTGLLLQRKVHWEAVLHPFQHDFDWVWGGEYHYGRTKQDRSVGSLIRYDDAGHERHKSAWIAWLIFPPIHLALLVIAVLFSRFRDVPITESVSGTYTVTTLFAVSVTAIIGIIVLVLAVGGAVLSPVLERRAAERQRDREGKQKPYVPKPPNRFYLWLQRVGKVIWTFLYGPFKAYGEHLAHAADERRRLLYEELACTNAPEHGIRPMTSMTFSISRARRLLYQEVKAKICKPVARG
ncbi:hypothetical protein A2763_02435 [Candidatus Kaiserbacteria bacterium RIFCSPHIGHO2_01_FULL_54_36]|uniref:Uncharacterized protein n=1 Tax=Candidatus Kaiserbacteria bacterium RIFCSPHIGHO2_01_FULL_54_36 TaxID=1798482 RepID=A0A1F6CNI5_9BACT|nr:MAG: hypothetical protein A2763_02435 [Candidatus Kaiserbacteria bacterium RIFCSPHIGHO2_01_FULL_54_36]OGG76017.1 MAG: hypothetical protein A3A41_03540 [Candidatus Kaiserbacteria bacterium RIFCSPLOWO2_01_FULL_54_22]